MMEAFTAKWFALYYPILGFFFMSLGFYLMIKASSFTHYLLEHSTGERPPQLVRTLLKYFLLFTLPCLVLSFIPFSYPELLFSLWSLCIIYLGGVQLVRWPQTCKLIQDHPQKAAKIIRLTGAVMLAVSPVIFLLDYFAIQKLTTM